MKVNEFIKILQNTKRDENTVVSFGTVDGDTGAEYDLEIDEEEFVFDGSDTTGNNVHIVAYVPDKYVNERKASLHISIRDELVDAVHDVLDKYNIE